MAPCSLIKAMTQVLLSGVTADFESSLKPRSVLQNWPSGAYMIFQHQNSRYHLTEKIVWLTTNAFFFRFWTVYPESLCHMYLLRDTIHISPILSVCASNFLNHYFVPYVCAFIFFKTCPWSEFFLRPRILSNLKMSPKLKYSQLPCSKPI